jgi:hypothetical protein
MICEQEKPVTHAHLVLRAQMYMRNALQCNPVFLERGCARTNEMPDAVGWHSGQCIVIECKTSKSDLLADAKKTFRIQPSLGMGQRRYYLLTIDLYNEIEKELSRYIPETWGIITHDRVLRHGRFRTMQRESGEFESNMVAERDFLRSRILEIQRFGV